MRYIYIVCFIFLCFNTTKAQQPGYMGKHFFVEGTFAAMHLGAASQNLNHVPVNIRYGLQLNYVVSRKATLGLNADFFNASAGVRIHQQLVDWAISENTFARYRLSGQAIGLSIALHRAKYRGLAPLGFYHAAGFKIVFTQNKFADGEEVPNVGRAEVGINSNIIEPPSTFANAGKRNKMYGVLTYEIGYRAIFANRITLKFAAQVGLSSSSIRFQSSDGSVNEAHSKAIRERVSNMFVFTPMISIGALIF